MDKDHRWVASYQNKKNQQGLPLSWVSCTSGSSSSEGVGPVSVLAIVEGSHAGCRTETRAEEQAEEKSSPEDGGEKAVEKTLALPAWES